MRIKAIFMLLVTIGLLTSCAQMRPSELPEDIPMVVVKDRRLKKDYGFPARAAYHGFIDARDAEGNCFRFEVLGKETTDTQASIENAELYADIVDERKVHVRTLVTGPKALRIIEHLKKNAEAYEPFMIYRPYPGPNSNTFAETMLRQTPELSAQLNDLCVGKHYDPTFRVGLSGGNDAVEFETGLIGVELGIHTGFELHLVGFNFGVALFPPAIKLPMILSWGWRAPVRIDRSEEYEEYPEGVEIKPTKAQ